MQNFWASYPFFWCSPHPSPLPFGLPVWSPEEGLQTKRTCFVISPRDEIEVHQPVGFTDCSFGLFWRRLRHVPFSHPFRGSVSPVIVASPRDFSLAPSTLGHSQLPQLPRHASRTAGQGCRGRGSVQQSLPTKASGKRGKRCWGRVRLIIVLGWASSQAVVGDMLCWTLGENRVKSVFMSELDVALGRYGNIV